MNHLFINRDYPPAAFPHGGIGTYVHQIATLLAERGDTVHVITQLWPGAAVRRDAAMGGRLTVHRVPLDEPALDGSADSAETLGWLQASAYPVQTFAWQAALLAESLAAHEHIDVIEAQEYEAPLYFFLLRRRLGLSSGPRVPVIVHLHTGTEFGFRYNGYEDRPDFVPASQLETYTIREADAILCPSRFLASLAARHYEIDEGAIAVIPYPVGLGPVLPRDDRTWSTGTILYVGRLEPRKGVAEWTTAAVVVASENPGLRFTFIGSDAPYEHGEKSTREELASRIPLNLRHRFTFLDFLPADQIGAHLASARMAVVPSRFENFPYTCIEAMASGIPVLASPDGGMAEMIEDGQTGWIAESCDPAGLEAAFRRALRTSPATLAQMGSEAASSIRRLCDNDRTIDQHRRFKRDVIGGRPRAWRSEPHVRDGPEGTGIAVVLDCGGQPDARLIQSVITQTTPPASVTCVTDGVMAPGLHLPPHWREVRRSECGSAFQEAFRLCQDTRNLLAVVVVDDTWTLAGDYVFRLTETFRTVPDVGIVVPWHHEHDTVMAAPPPIAVQGRVDQVSGCAAFRARAVAACTPALAGLSSDDARTHLAIEIATLRWGITSLPVPLARRDSGAGGTARDSDAAFRMGKTLTPMEVLRAPGEERRKLIQRAWADPGYVVRWLAWHGRRFLRTGMTRHP